MYLRRHFDLPELAGLQAGHRSSVTRPGRMRLRLSLDTSAERADFRLML